MKLYRRNLYVKIMQKFKYLRKYSNEVQAPKFELQPEYDYDNNRLASIVE